MPTKPEEIVPALLMPPAKVLTELTLIPTLLPPAEIVPPAALLMLPEKVLMSLTPMPVPPLTEIVPPRRHGGPLGDEDDSQQQQ